MRREHHECPAVGCTRTTKGLLCRVHTPMVPMEERLQLRKLRRLAKEDPFVWETQWNAAWKQVLERMAAKEGRSVAWLTDSTCSGAGAANRSSTGDVRRT